MNPTDCSSISLPIDSVVLHRLSIPFLMEFSHATASRSACDSFVCVVTSGPHTGVGETVFREYVSGGAQTHGAGTDDEALLDTTGRLIGDIVSDRANGYAKNASLGALQRVADRDDISADSLPAVCAAETAILDLLCGAAGCDLYQLLGAPPLRDSVLYGGTLPLASDATLRTLLETYRTLGVGNLRVKVDGDPSRCRDTLDLARKVLGDDFDLRVDANACWTEEQAAALIPIIMSRGVSIIEEPVGRHAALQTRLANRFPEITFAADESALSRADLETMHEQKNFGMINIRLAKNGGILRALGLAERAEELGISYQLGCHVGETGVLSAAGRATASLMRDPVYVDGSYDRYLLSANITRDHVSFGPGGHAPVVRGRGLGYEAELSRIERWSIGHRSCL